MLWANGQRDDCGADPSSPRTAPTIAPSRTTDLEKRRREAREALAVLLN